MLKELPYSSKGFIDHPKVQWFLSFIGYKRLKGPSQVIEKMFQPLPEKIRNAYIAQMNKTLYTETINKEMDSLHKSLSQLDERKIRLEKPLTIITAGIISNNEEGRKWKILQNKLLSKSNEAKQIIAENSDHMINHHQPKIIVDAIHEMIERKKEGNVTGPPSINKSYNLPIVCGKIEYPGKMPSFCTILSCLSMIYRPIILLQSN